LRGFFRLRGGREKKRARPLCVDSRPKKRISTREQGKTRGLDVVRVLLVEEKKGPSQSGREKKWGLELERKREVIGLRRGLGVADSLLSSGKRESQREAV